jgi:hypothetical protein
MLKRLIFGFSEICYSESVAYPRPALSLSSFKGSQSTLIAGSGFIFLLANTLHRAILEIRQCKFMNIVPRGLLVAQQVAGSGAAACRG